MNAVVLDIETTNLGAVGSGIILCVCMRSMHTQANKTFRLDQYKFKASKQFGFIEREETTLIKEVIAELESYNVVIGHFVVYFDIPYIKSRAFQHGLQINPLVAYDTYTAFRRSNYLTTPNGYGKPSAGLDMVADFLRVKQQKTKIYPNNWWDTIWAKEETRIEAMNEVVDHCSRDVRMNSEVFPYLWNADPKPTLKKIY